MAANSIITDQGMANFAGVDASGRLSVATNGTQNTTAALLTYAAAGAGTNGADQTNTSARGIKLFISITAITGTTPTFTVTLQGKDTISGAYYTILASAALNATGFTVLTVYPGITSSANTAANDVLPGTWRVISSIGGTTPAITATVSASLLG